MLEQLIEYYDNGNKSQFAKRLGVTPQGVSTWIARNTFDSELIFAKCENIDAEWLLTGEGSMLRPVKEQYSTIVCEPSIPYGRNKNSSMDYSSEIMPVASLFSERDNFVSIPLVDISVAAGCSGCENLDYLDIEDEIRMPVSMVKRDLQYFCIRVHGDSMSPSILDKAYVIARLMKRQEWGEIQDQQVYIISDREGRAYIKRLKNHLRDSGTIICTSDNPDKYRFGDFPIYENNINTVLHVEWCFSSNIPNINDTYYNKVNELDVKFNLLQDQFNKLVKANNLIR